MQIQNIMVLIFITCACDQSPVFHALVYVCYAFFKMIQALFKVNNFHHE